ncbi:aldo/keto reductase [Actomonas aquatica]|uniref:Aldo/keto reductase n=1 Tax=Actomonas aquatica TaxID=2866162 RepID=A0ABZ1C9G1_9BACT|nr:aldo/keto reductase [Opitutus sp. WL0086]WRQ88111.1 aldo/keto reductase [Opitutus sp. WL0086]
MTKHAFSGTRESTAAGLQEGVTLNTGASMPWLGLGVFKMGSDAETADAVRQAVKLGYRSIDTAALYGNERGVGEGVRSCGVARDALFVTTKLWNSDMREDRQREAFERSMELLGLDYVDLYLLHWPIDGKKAASWKVLEEIAASGRAKAIGVSNYMVPHLERLREVSGVVPAVNQIEYHPYLQSPELLAYCREKGIQVQAWSPLMHGGALLTDPVLAEIAARRGKTIAQVVLRWDLQTGVVTIPKTAKAARLQENADIFDFELDATEMAAIAAMNRDERSGADPMNFSF